MLDNKLLRQDAEALKENLRKRGFELDTQKIGELEEKRKQLQVKVENLQQDRNAKSKNIGKAKASGEDIAPLLKEVENLKSALSQAEEALNAIQAEWDELAFTIPNVLSDDVPEGRSEEDNREVSRWGEVPHFNFEPLDHVDLGAALGLDFEKAGTITGSRFVTMRADIARLHRALIQFMLDTHTGEHAYTEVYVPYIVNKESLFGTGQLPKFEEDLFKLEDEREFYLIPTAEVPVTNLLRDGIVDEASLPIKYVAHTPCFRSEAGSYGRDTRGMIRQHQFEKVELVQFVRPEDSSEALEKLTKDAETILQKLNLAYRKVLLCSGDIGFSSNKTYDLEVWLPSQNTYREISSCSCFSDFQARRLKARFKPEGGAKPTLLHTLNGSGLAIGRTLVAILENYQQSDGSVEIPEVLRGYMNQQSHIQPE